MHQLALQRHSLFLSPPLPVFICLCLSLSLSVTSGRRGQHPRRLVWTSQWSSIHSTAGREGRVDGREKRGGGGGREAEPPRRRRPRYRCISPSFPLACLKRAGKLRLRPHPPASQVTEATTDSSSLVRFWSSWLKTYYIIQYKFIFHLKILLFV